MRLSRVWGAVVGRGMQRLMALAAIVLAFGRPAAAEDLAIPYACKFTDGRVELSQGTENIYKIIGPRESQSFSWCPTGGVRCETLMVHRFAIQCGDQKISWAKVAEAARRLGAHLPEELPAGFAPVSVVAGRFIFPSLVDVPARRVAPAVVAETLSPDSIIVTDPPSGVRPEAASWQTEVAADLAPTGQNAGRVAAAIAVAMVLLAIASLIASGRLHFAHLAGFGAHARRGGAWSFPALGIIRVSIEGLAKKWRGSFGHGRGSSSSNHDPVVANAIATLQARSAEVQLRVALLDRGLLLRDVLESEVVQVKERAVNVQQEASRRPQSKTAAALRALLRELDRIERIAHSAAAFPQGEAFADRRASETLPTSAAEAYRMLGINPDSPPAAAKKMIDALRLSWHPDHARDETDRRRREERMKLINAAWDLIKDRQAEAA